MKTGYIIGNGFQKMLKMDELIWHFEELFKKHGCDIRVIKSDKAYACVGRDGSAGSGGIKEADFILFWDKDVMLARALEKEGYRLYNSARAIEICDNKVATHLFLSNCGIRMPKTIPAPLIFEGSEVNADRVLERAEACLDYPLVVKEAYGSFGQQVYLCKDREEARELVLKLKYKPFLFQEFVSESAGRDIRIYVVGGKVVASMLRTNDNDFRANISNGGRMSPIDPPQDYKEMAVKAAELIGLDYCGVDILMGKEGPLLCEVNSNAHFKNIQICTGIDVAEHFVKHILG
ncbi:MAG: RimK family alpha-L-glutamate ligase [Clostridiales bacterium]|jgi:gamma-F420-2:alpha-L-glutamate ligase|nr:RimK family alpha-L-glutamate ligase [Clostridiales bacterium]